MAINIEDTSIPPSTNVRPGSAERITSTAMMRGLRHTCPQCGEGALYERYLKVNDNCGTCGEALHHHRADDAPPYFTIFIVGHIVLAGVLAMEKAWKPEAWLHAIVWMPLTLILCLWMLPRIKGAMVGLQWALRMHGFGASNDVAAPTVAATPHGASRPS